MKIYKVKHIPTGLFYKPSKYPSKSNLSKTGKVYHTKPSLQYWLSFSHGLAYNHPTKDYPGYKTTATRLEDWEIIEGEI